MRRTSLGVLGLCWGKPGSNLFAQRTVNEENVGWPRRTPGCRAGLNYVCSEWTIRSASLGLVGLHVDAPESNALKQPKSKGFGQVGVAPVLCSERSTNVANGECSDRPIAGFLA